MTRTRAWIIGAWLGAAAASLPAQAHEPVRPPAAVAERADFGALAPSVAARRVADWAVATGDHQGAPFLLIDKPRARLYVFGASGRVQGSAPVLLGLARGDHTVPGIGDRELSQILPHERTTPAGRFVAERGRNLAGHDIFWIDYDAAVSLHRVRQIHPQERRLERLASPTAADNRISYGCVNVPAAFYDRVVDRTLGAKAVVYVLPDRLPLEQVFGLGNPPRPKATRRDSPG